MVPLFNLQAHATHCPSFCSQPIPALPQFLEYTTLFAATSGLLHFQFCLPKCSFSDSCIYCSLTFFQPNSRVHPPGSLLCLPCSREDLVLSPTPSVLLLCIFFHSTDHNQKSSYLHFAFLLIALFLHWNVCSTVAGTLVFMSIVVFLVLMNAPDIQWSLME